MRKTCQLPILIEKDDDGFYVVECPVFSGCYTQGKTVDEALKNIREVIELCLEEKENIGVLSNKPGIIIAWLVLCDKSHRYSSGVIYDAVIGVQKGKQCLRKQELFYLWY